MATAAACTESETASLEVAAVLALTTARGQRAAIEAEHRVGDRVRREVLEETPPRSNRATASRLLSQQCAHQRSAQRVHVFRRNQHGGRLIDHLAYRAEIAHDDRTLEGHRLEHCAAEALSATG